MVRWAPERIRRLVRKLKLAWQRRGCRAPPSLRRRDRSTEMLHRLNCSMSLIEIGPSHRPLVPKRAGWRTTVVDHASRDGLAAKYASHDLDLTALEEVDVIWSGGDLARHFSDEKLGRYDAIVASHVIEHMPDPISFLKSAISLLSSTGLIILAIPDRRYSFDFFAPLTSTADWLTAHEAKAQTHTKRAAFNHVAYAASEAGKISWRDAPLGDLKLVHTLAEAETHFLTASDSGAGCYVDYHAWRFTPSSFMLVLLETIILCRLDLCLVECTPPLNHEFFVTIARGPAVPLTDEELQETRLRLLKAAIREAGSQAALLPARIEP